MKTTDTHVYFCGESSIYSNWHGCNFVYDGIRFENTEQAFVWCKAKYFEDEKTAKMIELEGDPKEVKALGRQVKGYNDESWSVVRSLYMIDVNTEKFQQNAFYKQILINTENRILVNASPNDKIWGVGLAANDPLILDEKKWLGKNLLGEALMHVRKKIKKKPMNIFDIR